MILELLKGIWVSVLHVLESSRYDEKVSKEINLGTKKPPVPAALQRQIDLEQKNVTEIVEGSAPTSIQNSHDSLKLRILNITKQLTNEVLLQNFGTSELQEINIIHPDYVAYSYTTNASIASEKTENEVKKRAKIDYNDAVSYVYAAMSFQWRKKYAYLVSQEGRKVYVLEGNRVMGSKLRASIKELFRQSIWSSSEVADKFLLKYGITDMQLCEYLLFLANDELEFVKKGDKPKVS